MKSLSMFGMLGDFFGLSSGIKGHSSLRTICGMSDRHDFELVAIGAHPNDAELFAGVTMAKSATQG